MLGDERLEPRQHLGVAAERHLRVVELLERSHAHILEAGALALRERLAREVREGRAAPEGERPLQHLDGRLRITGGKLASPLRDERLEALGIDVAGLDLQLVAVVAGEDDLSGAARQRARERLPQP